MVKLFLPIRRKLFFGHFLAVLLVCGTVGSYIYLSAVDNLKGSLQSRLRNSAALLSEILDAGRLDEIQGEAVPTLPVYQQDLALLRAFRRSNPDIAYLYVMRRVADRVYFVLDSDETERQAASIRNRFRPCWKVSLSPRWTTKSSPMNGGQRSQDMPP